MKRLWRFALHLVAPAGIPFAWKQLAADKKRLITAIAGVTFGTMLMLFQLGLYNAINTMVVLPHFNLEGELVMTSPDYEYFGSSRQFTRRRLLQAAALPEVRSVAPLYVGFVYWQNPVTRVTKSMFVMAIDPGRNPFTNPAIRKETILLHDPEAVLFDALSQNTYGPVVRMFQNGPVQTEINQRHVSVQGLYEIGPTLAASANVVMSDENLFRYRPDRRNMPDIGMISLQPGANAQQAAARLRRMLPQDVRIQTREEFIAAERLYWKSRTPIGFVVTAGMIVGMFVGGIVVYQILYTDVNDHLKEYATLKAMGVGDSFFIALILQEALILVGLAFLPAVALTLWIDRLARERVAIPANLEPVQALLVLAAVSVMCLLAGQLATRRLRSADPASVF